MNKEIKESGCDSGRQKASAFLRRRNVIISA